MNEAYAVCGLVNETLVCGQLHATCTTLLGRCGPRTETKYSVLRGSTTPGSSPMAADRASWFAGGREVHPRYQRGGLGYPKLYLYIRFRQ